MLDQKQTKRDIIKLCGPRLDAATHWISSGYTRFDTIKKRSALSKPVLTFLYYTAYYYKRAHALTNLLDIFRRLLCISLYINMYKCFLSKNTFKEEVGMTNSLDLDQTRLSVRSDPGTNCLQNIPADNFISLKNDSFTIVLYCIVLYG